MPKDTGKDLGFIELSAGQNPIVDIVAIHGLDGHREKSWTAEDGTMWLRDLLPHKFPDARILTYGYDADTRSFAHTSTQTIFRHAEAFAEDLSRQRRACPEASRISRPIIFIAHSLGGIILKRALAHCHNRSFDSPYAFRDIITSTLAVLFFGTPHGGANGVALAKWMHRLASIYMSTSNTILKDLDRDSPALEEIQALYLQSSERIDAMFFYEEYPTPIGGGLAKMIVPRNLAIIPGDRNARVVVLHANHCTMVRYTGHEDENYRKVADYLHELVKEGPAKIRDNWIRETGHRGIAKGEAVPTPQTILPKPLISVSTNYVQRPHIERFLSEKLLPVNLTARQPRCVLHGLGGGGKTQIASSWIEAHRNRIIVIDASNREQIETDLETAMRSIGPQYSKSTWKDTVAYLASQKGWLVLFDNADSRDLVLDDYLPNSIHGAILVTSRNRECMNYAPESHIQVGELTEAEAVDLLHKVARIPPSSHDSSLAIVKELGMWALAITQAGAYILKTGRIDTYLSTFRRHRDELMREASLKGRNYKGSTYTAFDLSFGQLSTKAQELMRICAFLHYSSIPQSLFKRSTTSSFRAHSFNKYFPPPNGDNAPISHLEDILGSEWDDHSFQELIDAISQGSLMDMSIDDNGEIFYGLHPLVQAYIRDLLNPIDHDRYALSAGQMLLGAIRRLSNGETNIWHRKLSFHIASLPKRIRLADPAHALAFRRMYKSVGNWNGMQELDEYCYSRLLEMFGPRHLATIQSMRYLAATLWRRGQLEEAEKLQRAGLELSIEILGQKHRDTVQAIGNLALTLLDRGQLEEAEKLQQEVLELSIEILGQKDPNTVMAMGNLASTLCRRGQLEEAEKLEREVLELSIEILGQKHPDTVRAIGNLASTLWSRGQLEEAEKLDREVLELRIEILGQKHPDTVLAMGSLASTLWSRGQLEEAEKLHREVLELRIEILGQKHPDTVRAIGNLALTLADRGQLEEAEKLDREVLAFGITFLGAHHPDTIIAIGNLARTLFQRGQLEAAEEMEQEVLALRTKVLGAHHPHTILAQDNLAITTKRLALRRTQAPDGV
ncbi:hypothetical protein FRC17_008464 [Serendipita sp. 399]|nr:hypothetical protein FRC17_008464 [Serendipita sp. 399]